MNFWTWLLARKECKVCNELRVQLATERRRYDELLEHVLSPDIDSVQVQEQSPEEYKPIPSNVKHWHIERAKLEEASRRRAEELERQVLLNESNTKLSAGSSETTSGEDTKRDSEAAGG